MNLKNYLLLILVVGCISCSSDKSLARVTAGDSQSKIQIELCGRKVTERHLTENGEKSSVPEVRIATIEEVSKFWKTVDELTLDKWLDTYVGPTATSISYTDWKVEIRNNGSHLEKCGFGIYPSSLKAPKIGTPMRSGPFFDLFKAFVDIRSQM